MIDVRIHVEDGKVADSFTKRKVTMDEVAATLYRLEQIKLVLLDLEFDSDLIVEEEDDDSI